MALIIPHEGTLVLTDHLFDNLNPTTVYLRLITDAATLDADSVRADAIAAEAAFGGYAFASVLTADWSSASTVSGAAKVSTAGYYDFTCDGTATVPQTIKYYIVDDNTKMLWFEELSTPQVVEFDGDQVSIKLNFTFASA